MLNQQLINIPNHFIFAKDLHGRFLFANENFTEIAGFDSPTHAEGKTDKQAYWHQQADFFRDGDIAVMNGLRMINCHETQIQENKLADILTTKTPLLNAKNKIIGVIGSYVDITGQRLKHKTGYYDAEKKRFYLGKRFFNDYLTECEFRIFKYILLGQSAAYIAKSLNCSRRTVEAHTNKIKLKLQCSSKSDIIAKALMTGLSHIIN